MRILKLKQSSFFATLALIAILFGTAQAQETPPPPPQTQETKQAAEQPPAAEAAQTTDAVGQTRETAPPRRDGLVIPEIIALVGPVVVQGTGNSRDSVEYMSLIGVAPGSGYGEVITSPITMARVFFSDTLRATGAVLTSRIGGTSLRLPLTVQAVSGGFLITNKEPDVKVVNLFTEEEYGIGDVIPYAGTSAVSQVVDVEFPAPVTGLQVVIDKPDSKSWTGINFIRVRKARQGSPTRP